jgi:Domain of unknown function (DUF4352)
MLPLKKLSVTLLFGLLILTACSSANGTSATSTIAAPSPQPTATKALPTPSTPGDSILWNALQVTMAQAEVTQDYVTDYGSTRIPPPGDKFLWIHVQLKNTGQIKTNVPLSENFSVLYAATELKPTYGHRKDYADYTALDSVIFPNQKLDGWLRFDLPIAAELKDLLCVYLPESSQVGTTFSSPIYPYSEDKPTFVWKCAP